MLTIKFQSYKRQSAKHGFPVYRAGRAGRATHATAGRVDKRSAAPGIVMTTGMASELQHCKLQTLSGSYRS